MSDLKAALEKLASDFAAAAVTAIQHASLNDIAGIGERQSSSAPHTPRAAAPRAARGGRHHRRSAADIAKVTGEIAALLAKHKGGLRAEQIRAELGISKAELLGPIAEGLASGKFRKGGQKRATTYFVGGGGAAAKNAKPKAKRASKAKHSRKATPTKKRKAASARRRAAHFAKKPASAPKATAAATSAS